MNWILEHLQFVLAVAGAFAFWLKQRADARAELRQSGEKKPDPSLQQHPDAGEDHTRRIQEEIRRKIAERRGEAVPPETSAAPTIHELPPIPGTRPVATELPRRLQVDLEAKLKEARARDEVLRRERAARLAAQRQAEAAEEAEQAEAQKRLLALAQRKAAAEARAVAARSSRPLHDISLEALRGPANLRRAVILREIIGPPVGLR